MEVIFPGWQLVYRHGGTGVSLNIVGTNAEGALRDYLAFQCRAKTLTWFVFS
jgi:hypothetical protein